MNSRLSASVAVGLLAACASEPPPPPVPPVPRERVILLPQSDGAASAVIVRRGDEQTALDKPYASARPAPEGKIEMGQADPDATRTEFADVLRALPAAPASFVVYFVFGQDELTEESRKAFAPVREDFARRPAPEITVIGHTDQAGGDKVNDAGAAGIACSTSANSLRVASASASPTSSLPSTAGRAVA